MEWICLGYTVINNTINYRQLRFHGIKAGPNFMKLNNNKADS